MVAQLIGSLLPLLGYAIVGYGLYQLGVVLRELTEIKELLRDIRLNTDHGARDPFARSAANLAREVGPASYSEAMDRLSTDSEPLR
jgi:hypothetical protein